MSIEPGYYRCRHVSEEDSDTITVGQLVYVVQSEKPDTVDVVWAEQHYTWSVDEFEDEFVSAPEGEQEIQESITRTVGEIADLQNGLGQSSAKMIGFSPHVAQEKTCSAQPAEK